MVLIYKQEGGKLVDVSIAHLPASELLMAIEEATGQELDKCPTYISDGSRIIKVLD